MPHNRLDAATKWIKLAVSSWLHFFFCARPPRPHAVGQTLALVGRPAPDEKSWPSPGVGHWRLRSRPRMLVVVARHHQVGRLLDKLNRHQLVCWLVKSCLPAARRWVGAHMVRDSAQTSRPKVAHIRAQLVGKLPPLSHGDVARWWRWNGALIAFGRQRQRHC